MFSVQKLRDIDCELRLQEIYGNQKGQIMKFCSMETRIGKTLIYFLSLQALGSQKTVRITWLLYRHHKENKEILFTWPKSWSL